MVGGVVRRRETVGTTPKQRHSNMVADCGEPPPRMAVRRRSVSHRNPVGGVTGRHPTCGVAQTGRRETDGGPRNSHGRILPEAWNRIKASLSAFQRREVKVLGFGVKARPRPQRMALRWVYDPFALVGANGKACGEASRVSFPGIPPGVWVASLPCCWCVGCVWCVGWVRPLAWFVS
nr:MAG TPA: hypothetical protein [Caudoviricetes sp.]